MFSMAYHFEYDWFSGHIPRFTRLLGEFKGTPATGLEIGTHEGRSCVWMMKNILTDAGSKLITVDAFEQSVLRSNIEECGCLDRVDVRIGLSRDVLPTVARGSIDFAYIDGSHWSCDVLEDAVNVFRLVRVGGVIGFDDYLWDDPSFNQHGTPKPAIDAFLLCYSHKVTLLEKSSQVWIRKENE